MNSDAAGPQASAKQGSAISTAFSAAFSAAFCAAVCAAFPAGQWRRECWLPRSATTATRSLHWVLLLVVLQAGCASDRRLESVLSDARYTEALLHYELDRSATRIGFRVGDTRGRFRVVDARLSFPTPVLDAAVLEVTIATASLDLFNPLLEQMLRGPEWFHSSEHPSARFQSATVQVVGPTAIDVAGTLTIRTIGQPLAVHVEFPDRSALPDLSEPPAEIRFLASGAFLRSAFGMDALQSFAPDRVELEIDGVLRRIDQPPALQ